MSVITKVFEYCLEKILDIYFTFHPNPFSFVALAAVASLFSPLVEQSII